MGIILDADVVIRGERGDLDLPAWLATHPEDDFEIASITVAELWHGVERATSPHRLRRAQYLRAVLDALPIIPYTEQIAYQHAQLWANLESAGTMIGAYDLIVAATALDRGSALATYNRRHFSRVDGLKILQPGKD
jgi:predicted nucleic acid-binding protein